MAAIVFIFVFCIVAAGLTFAVERIYANRQARLARLISRYNDSEIANRVFRREIWLGQTGQQLLDSRGTPAGVDFAHLGAQKREIWKYGPLGADRYHLRVTLESGSVAGWQPER
jgi:hypothetical protein